MFECRTTTGLNAAVLVPLVLGYVEIKTRRTMDASLHNYNIKRATAHMPHNGEDRRWAVDKGTDIE